MSASQPVQVGPTSSMLPLKYPQSVAIFDSYADAQKAVDYLADQRFPVENLCIVGTDLKSIERVLGRRSWTQILAGGAISGIGTGLIVGLFMMLIYPQLHLGMALIGGLVIGIAMGLLSSVMAQSAARGRQRDFNSVTSTVATRYEVLGEHNVVQQARELLAKMPGARAAAFANGGYGATPQGWPQQPQQWGYPQQGYPGHPQQTYPQQPYPQQAYPQQTYPQQTYPPGWTQPGSAQPPAQGGYPAGSEPSASWPPPETGGHDADRPDDEQPR